MNQNPNMRPDIAELLSSKIIKPKQKTEELSKLVAAGKIKTDDLISFAGSAKDPDKATCVEALEFATKTNPELLNGKGFNFVVKCLNEKAPRVKWESAKVIGNCAHLYRNKLDEAIKNLLVNSEHSGTVVRWSAAFALGEILKLKTTHNKELLPAVNAIIRREEKNSIKKIYAAALKLAV